MNSANVALALKKMGFTPEAAMKMARDAVLNEQIKLGASSKFIEACMRQGMPADQIEATWRFILECARDREG